MKKHPLSTVVNFCSNESRFIQATLEQALTFSLQVIVPVCDHFFDGAPENRPLLEKIYAAFPECLFIEYPYLPQKIPKKIWKKIHPAHFWHSFSRLVGFSFLNEEIEMVLFLDADEVPDGRRFAEWLDCSDYRHHTAIKLLSYWYFRDASNQALEQEEAAVLVQKSALESQMLLHQDEREALYNLLPHPKRRHVAGTDGKPMFHHYSWVRTKEEMLQKVRSWGHREDRDWESLIHEEFTAPFRGTDFVHGYQYQNVKPFFDCRVEIPLFEAKGSPQIRRLKSKEVLELVRQKNFLDPLLKIFRS